MKTAVIKLSSLVILMPSIWRVRRLISDYNKWGRTIRCSKNILLNILFIREEKTSSVTNSFGETDGVLRVHNSESTSKKKRWEGGAWKIEYISTNVKQQIIFVVPHRELSRSWIDSVET